MHHTTEGPARQCNVDHTCIHLHKANVLERQKKAHQARAAGCEGAAVRGERLKEENGGSASCCKPWRKRGRAGAVLFYRCRPSAREIETERDSRRRRQSLCFPGLISGYRLVVRGVPCSAKRHECFRCLRCGDPMRAWRHCAGLLLL
jgi:hypothetical protein